MLGNTYLDQSKSFSVFGHMNKLSFLRLNPAIHW